MKDQIAESCELSSHFKDILANIIMLNHCFTQEEVRPKQLLTLIRLNLFIALDSTELIDDIIRSRPFRLLLILYVLEFHRSSPYSQSVNVIIDAVYYEISIIVKINTGTQLKLSMKNVFGS